ncbi:MAG: ribosome assembly cofactor RimP [Vicingaceae bacterium]
MITKEQILDLIQAKLDEMECFLVELQIDEGNKIAIEIDSHNGVDVADCVALSKVIDDNLDREVEDFEMNVSSAGLDKPLRVLEQYKKNIGRTVKVVPVDGLVVKGELAEVTEEEIMVEYTVKEKIEGRKKKEAVVKQEKIKFNNIKETTIIISFK